MNRQTAKNRRKFVSVQELHHGWTIPLFKSAMLRSTKREQAIPRDGVGLLTSANFSEDIFQPSSISGSDSLEDILDQLRGKQEEDIL